MQLAIVFACMVVIVGLFIRDRVRHDFVALAALFVIVVTGIIPIDTAFNGFANPAVVTVVAVMIISNGMQSSGLLDILTKRLNWVGHHPVNILLPLSFLTAAASALMNNVSVVMPLSIRLAKKRHRSPSLFLMPLAFATLLGGMITLVGSAPNIIVSSFRAEAIQESFGVFDFARVGLPVALVGILYISLIGWRFLPKRKSPLTLPESIEIENYRTEVLITEASDLIGSTVLEIQEHKDFNIELAGIIRAGQYLYSLSPTDQLQLNDILMVKANFENLRAFVEQSKLTIVIDSEADDELNENEEVSLLEVVVMNDSLLIGRTAKDLNLSHQYGIRLLAKTVSDKLSKQRINQQKIQSGDVLLLQGNPLTLPETVVALGCLALTEKDYNIGHEKRVWGYLAIYAITIVVVILRWLPVHIAFPMGALTMVVSGIIPSKEVYKSIDWSVIVMLGAMIPFGRALIISGGADLIGRALLSLAHLSPPWVLISLLLLLTMILTNMINNATTSILMAPIAIALAEGLQQSPDIYLMTVAVGACSAFLTPIGHQSNALVKGPGGYRFGDYYKVGLGVQILVLIVAVPLLLHYWG